MISGARNSILKWHHIDVKGTIISPRRHLLPIHTHQAGGGKSLLKTKTPPLACPLQTDANTCLFLLCSPYCIMNFQSHSDEQNPPLSAPTWWKLINRCPGGTGEPRRGSTHSIAFIPIAAITNGMSMTKANLPTGLQSMKHLTIWPQGLAAM